MFTFFLTSASAAVVDTHVFGNRSGKRGLLPGQSQLDRLVAGGLRREHDRGAGVGHRGRTDRRVRRGQSRVAQSHGHLLRRQPERVGGDLPHHGVGAGAEVVRPGLDECVTVTIDRNSCLGRPSPMGVDRAAIP